MSNPLDPFEFVKQLWGQMAVPGFGLTGNAGAGGASMPGGMQMPSFDPKELEKRLAELKQVKQWLDMNLNMMSLQINTLEMQLATMNGLQAASTKVFGESSHETVGGSGYQADAAPVAAPWMDPQTWIGFLQQQAAATQRAAQKAMEDGAKAVQDVTQTPASARSETSARPAAGRAAPAKRAPRKKKS